MLGNHTEVMLAQPCECTKCHRTVHFKMIKMANLNFMYILPPLEKKKDRKITLSSGNQITLGAKDQLFPYFWKQNTGKIAEFKSQ